MRRSVGGHAGSARPSGLVLGIAASARKKGNSSALLRRVLDGLNGEFRTELVFLADTEIRPCAGCHYCETKGACRIEDGMTALYPKLFEADVILLASPAYMGGLASRMQAFMERTWPLRKGQLAGKLASYIVTGRRRIGMATGVMEEYFTRLGVTKLPGVLGFAFESGEVEQDREAVAQAERLAADVGDLLRTKVAPRTHNGCCFGAQEMNEYSPSSRRTACICCNGELRGFRRARELAVGTDLLIAADGGAEYVQALGLKPHAIIGDMDSLREDPWPDDEDIQRVPLSPDKDKCDGECAVEWAFEHGCDKAMLLAAWGGRVDQALGNCALLMRYPGKLALWDDGILVVAMSAGQEMVLPVAVGTTVSVISLQSSTLIRTEGLTYGLNGEPLRSATHGISNMAMTARPVVSVVSGVALVCMEGGETWLNE